MSDYAELEISLFRWSELGYNIELRFNPARSDTFARFTGRPNSFVRLDLFQLKQLERDDEQYGAYLTEALLADPLIAGQFEAARASHEAIDTDLRVRLYLGPTATALHSVRWEVLRDPRDRTRPFFTQPRVLFSRFLTARDFRPVRAKSRDRLRCLTVVANPKNLSEYAPEGRLLGQIDVDKEISIARNSFERAEMTIFASGGSSTLDKIIEELQRGYVDDEGGAYDMLYLVCHGASVKNRTKLYLENDAGNVEVVSGDDLVTRFAEIKHQPRLVVFAACQSAASPNPNRGGDKGALSGLGPKLAEAGIPAVIAMQDDVSMLTAETFFKAFFIGLEESGEIDRAVAAARGSVRNREDWWVPVLYMRLQTGQMWYLKGLGQGRPAFVRWAALLRHIDDKKCTPILGSGLAESILGSTKEIARRWAETYRLPMSVEEREDLPQVAQYLAVTQARTFPRDELRAYLLREVVRRYPDRFPEGVGNTNLTDAVNKIGEHIGKTEPLEAHETLAQLKLPLYIVAKPDELMTKALQRAGVKPRVELFEWRDDPEPSELRTLQNDHPASAEYPSTDEPLVYHLFGKLGEPRSIVLTEDDYFDYLIGITSKRAAIPFVVRRALTDSSLLFLGFRIDEWSFRVLFRSLLSQPSARRGDYAHVAVQIDPAESRITEPELARQYLEGYFSSFIKLNIYWGTIEEFVRDLRSQWLTAYGKELGT